jgi:iron complex transport system permease protein
MDMTATGKNILLFALLSSLTVLLLVADIFLGSVGISASDVWAAVCGRDADPAISHIILNFRIPKAITALLAGASLSAVGLQMQTLFRNPLAGPYVLGVSSGASLGVALFTLGMPLLGISASEMWWGNVGMAGAAWIGAAAIMLGILAVTARIRDIMAVLVIGMMFGSAATAVVEILQYLSPEGAVKGFVVWTMGSLGGVTVARMWIMVPVLLAGILLSVMLIKPLNMLMLGENYARTMGLNIGLVRRLIIVAAIMLAGTVTAYCGPIGFIGLAVPHIVRMLFAQADHRVLMPASILAGAGIMLLCDIVSQFPSSGLTLPINTITALIGIPVVVIVIMRYRKRNG